MIKKQITKKNENKCNISNNLKKFIERRKADLSTASLEKKYKIKSYFNIGRK